MSFYSLSTCAKLLNISYKGTDVSFSSISIDTRTLQAKSLFIAIQGDQFDGHHFLETAVQKGAVAAIVQKDISCLIPYLKVKNTKQALGLIAKYHRAQLSPWVVGITGSCGKTTTKNYLENILISSHPVLASPRSFNNEIGVPLTLLQLNSTHHFLLLEMGANAIGEIAWLTHIARPSIALLLNISSAHIGTFGSLQKTAQAKSEIFKTLEKPAMSIVHESVIKMWPQHMPKYNVLSFGQTVFSEISAHTIACHANNCFTFVLATPKGSINVQLTLPGQHQIDNALAAAATAHILGISLERIKTGLESMLPLPGRLQQRYSKSGFKILDDTYNASPQSVHAALHVLSYTSGQRLFVMGDMSELGQESANYHHRVGMWAKQYNIHAVFTCGNDSKYISETFGKNGQHFASQIRLIAALKQYLEKKDITILVKGSRAAKMENIVNTLLTL